MLLEKILKPWPTSVNISIYDHKHDKINTDMNDKYTKNVKQAHNVTIFK